MFIERFPVVVRALPVRNGEAVGGSDYALVDEQAALYVRVRPRIRERVIIVQGHLWKETGGLRLRKHPFCKFVHNHRQANAVQKEKCIGLCVFLPTNACIRIVVPLQYLLTILTWEQSCATRLSRVQNSCFPHDTKVGLSPKCRFAMSVCHDKFLPYLTKQVCIHDNMLLAVWSLPA